MVRGCLFLRYGILMFFHVTIRFRDHLGLKTFSLSDLYSFRTLLLVTATCLQLHIF